MRLERDNIPLDKEFPFQISEVELTPGEQSAWKLSLAQLFRDHLCAGGQREIIL